MHVKRLWILCLWEVCVIIWLWYGYDHNNVAMDSSKLIIQWNACYSKFCWFLFSATVPTFGQHTHTHTKKTSPEPSSSQQNWTVSTRKTQKQPNTKHTFKKKDEKIKQLRGFSLVVNFICLASLAKIGIVANLLLNYYCYWGGSPQPPVLCLHVL